MRHAKDPGFRLCHYFDLIAGSSTGAIIAAALALGMTVAEVIGHYQKLGRGLFLKGWFRKGIVRARYDENKLTAHLKRVFGKDRTLGDESLLTGLRVMTKRLDTGSPWPLGNNPRGRYSRRSNETPGSRTETIRSGRWYVRQPRLRRISIPEPSPSRPRKARKPHRYVCGRRSEPVQQPVFSGILVGDAFRLPRPVGDGSGTATARVGRNWRPRSRPDAHEPSRRGSRQGVAQPHGRLCCPGRDPDAVDVGEPDRSGD